MRKGKSLITPFSWAKCLPPFWAADYGCLYLRHLLWRKIGSRFLMSLFPKTDKEASRKFCARFGEPITPGSLYYQVQ